MWLNTFFLLFTFSSFLAYSFSMPQTCPLSLEEWTACETFIQTKADSFFARGVFLIPSNTELPCPIEKDPNTGSLYILLKGRKDSAIGIGSHKIVTKAILYKKHPIIVAQCECDQTGTSEAQALARMANVSGIIQCYSFIPKSDQSSTFFLEYCPLGSLKGKSIPLETVPLLMKDLLEALIGLHKQGYIHRDIKPDNIFLKETGGRIRAILGDLGLACEIKNATGRHIGVPNQTCAPEILLHPNSELDPRKAETYSLGVLFYYMLFHHFPRYGNIPQREIREESQEKKRERYQYIENEYQKEIRKKLSSRTKQRLFELIMKMLHPDPSQRITLLNSSYALSGPGLFGIVQRDPSILSSS